MSVALIQDAIKRFVTDETPKVCCLRGKWGVGKTFAWDRILKELSGQGRVTPKRYAYVSLFGVQSLAELKFAIFERSVPALDGLSSPTLSSYASNIKSAYEVLGRRAFGFVQKLPGFRSRVGELPFSDLAIRNTLICIDDIERKGAGLSVRDVLGLASQLKETRSCKVLLILNDEALDEDTAEFHRYFEKVVDLSWKFAPTPAEAADVALLDTAPHRDLISQATVTLGISNIRLIRKIEQSVALLAEPLAPFHHSVFQSAIKTAALLTWSRYDPDSAPPLVFIERRAANFLGIKDEEVSPKHGPWTALLDEFGFSGMDDLDRVILAGILDGYFNDDRLKAAAEPMDKNITSHQSAEAFYDSWAPYHESFDDNPEEVANSIERGALENMAAINARDLDGAFQVLKRLGREDQASALLKTFRETHPTSGIEPYVAYWGHKFHPEVARALAQEVPEATPLDLASVLNSVSSRNGWSSDEARIMASASPEQYRDVFKGTRGGNLHKLVKTSLGISESSGSARSALKLIASESDLNASRVDRYGISVTDGKVEPPDPANNL